MLPTELARRLLRAAKGFDVYGADGDWLGKFAKLIELTDGSEGTIVIRRNRVIFSRKYLAPVALVARVDPEERAVILVVDRHTLARIDRLQPDEVSPGWVGRRLAGHVADDTVDDLAEFASDSHEQRFRHLLFVPTASGYVIAESAESVPSRGSVIDIADPPGKFVVLKVAPSPFPNDERPCVYLDRVS